MFYTYYFHMKKLFTLTGLLLTIVILSGCDKSHNFMDVDNPNAKEDLLNLIWTWNIAKINSWNIIPDSLSWTRDTAKWYVNQYYEDTLQGYVDQAKQWLSWAVKSLKNYYNSWVDQITNTINDKVTWTISWELKKIKL